MKLLFTIAVSLFIAIAAFAQEADNLIQSPATSFVVNNNGDTNDANIYDNVCSDAAGNCTLRAAIQQANTLAGNDTITFALTTPATINLFSQLSISQSVTITGPGARNLTVQRNASVAVSRIFNIQQFAVATVNISGVTIANGKVISDHGGGIRSESGNTLNLSEVIVRDNTAEFGAGFFQLRRA